jgi:hypothetical protein
MTHGSSFYVLAAAMGAIRNGPASDEHLHVAVPVLIAVAMFRIGARRRKPAD